MRRSVNERRPPDSASDAARIQQPGRLQDHRAPRSPAAAAAGTDSDAATDGRSTPTSGPRVACLKHTLAKHAWRSQTGRVVRLRAAHGKRRPSHNAGHTRSPAILESNAHASRRAGIAVAFPMSGVHRHSSPPPAQTAKRSEALAAAVCLKQRLVRAPVEPCLCPRTGISAFRDEEPQRAVSREVVSPVGPP